MHEHINEKVSVLAAYHRQRRLVMPVRLKWQGRTYTLTKLGLHHTFREGRVLHHVFSVSDGATFFRLDLNTESLEWRLMEISDGLPN
jgi:hypothetical protein